MTKYVSSESYNSIGCELKILRGDQYEKLYKKYRRWK